MSMESLGGRIAELRKKNQLTQQELADKMGIKRELINYYENGTRQPKINDVINMSKIFDVTTDYILLGGNCKKADNFEISKRLGLSDEAIAAIEKTKNYKHGSLRIDVLNELFSGLWIDEFIVLLIKHAEILYEFLNYVPQECDDGTKKMYIDMLSRLEFEFQKYSYSFVQKLVNKNYEELKANENFNKFIEPNKEISKLLRKVIENSIKKTDKILCDSEDNKKGELNNNASEKQ